MKKIIICLTTLLLTACLGETGKGYITKKCTKKESVNGLFIEKKITIKSKKGEVENIKIEEIYDEKLDINSSKKSEKNEYDKIDGINLEISNNKYIYDIDTKKINEELKEKFKIKEEQYKQIKEYETEGYTCK
jgi:hypothetical protein